MDSLKSRGNVSKRLRDFLRVERVFIVSLLVNVWKYNNLPHKEKKRERSKKSLKFLLFRHM